eukprot:1160640-Pelagomonas_calceolata.AAC.12
MKVRTAGRHMHLLYEYGLVWYNAKIQIHTAIVQLLALSMVLSWHAGAHSCRGHAHYKNRVRPACDVAFP